MNLPLQIESQMNAISGLRNFRVCSLLLSLFFFGSVYGQVAEADSLKLVLLGNLSLFLPDDGQAFNAYAHKLHSLGPLVYAAELGLLAVILLHALIGVAIWIRKRRSRPVGYEVYYRLASIQLQLGNTARAEEFCRQALGYDPSSVEAGKLMESILAEGDL